jgi:hypothetical protein
VSSYSGIQEGDFVVTEDKIVIQVPPGHMWVEGDNVSASVDSREYGPIPMNLITGFAHTIHPWKWRLNDANYYKNHTGHSLVTTRSGVHALIYGSKYQDEM